MWNTASVHFCEEKYNDYVAEIFITTSSIFYILAGIYFINTPIYKLAYSAIGIGVGSALLHGTQRRAAQWADEISMICLIFYIIQKFNVKLKDIYLVAIICTYLFFSSLFSFFLVTFSVGQIYVMSKVFYFNVHGKLHCITFLSGFYCWLLDQFACEYVREYNLHAWWHFLSALSIFFGFKAILN